MRTLLRFIQKYHLLLLFLLLELIAMVFIMESSHFQRSRIVNVNRQISGFFYKQVSGSREYLGLKQANKVLLDENTALRNRVYQLSSHFDSSSVVHDVKDNIHFSFMPARVVKNSVNKQYNYMTLDKGKKQGVFRDMGVVSEQGLVGIILESSDHYSTVIPVINRDFRISAKIVSNNYSGILQWEGLNPRMVLLKEIPFHVEVNKGDTIATSGFSSIFPEGIEVGIIEDYSLEKGNFFDIKVSLFTEFQSLFYVNVIRNYRQEEQLNLENKH